MTTKPWSITYVDETWYTSTNGESSEGHGFYLINFDDCYYGMITKQAWDNQTTGQILDLVEHMLNDAHDLALRQKDE
jgi:hypothetical protein